ncbi:MAG: hypothetical protein ACK4GN_17570 [Runella sp.]
MQFATFAIRAWRVFSMMLVFGGVVYSYTLFSADVGIHFDEQGKPDEFMHKSDIFYLLVGIILTNNVLIMALARQLLKLPGHLLPIPHQAEWAAQRDLLNEHLQNWFYALIAMINTLVALTVLVLATVNSEFKYKIYDFTWLFYLVIFSLLVIIVALPIRLSIKPKAEE